MQEVKYTGTAPVLVKLTDKRSVVFRVQPLQQCKGDKTWGVGEVVYGPAPHSECVEFVWDEGDTLPDA